MYFLRQYYVVQPFCSFQWVMYGWLTHSETKVSLDSLQRYCGISRHSFDKPHRMLAQLPPSSSMLLLLSCWSMQTFPNCIFCSTQRLQLVSGNTMILTISQSMNCFPWLLFMDTKTEYERTDNKLHTERRSYMTLIARQMTHCARQFESLTKKIQLTVGYPLVIIGVMGKQHVFILKWWFYQ